MDLLKNILKGDKVVWIILILLSIVSITEVFSASSSMSYHSGNYLKPISGHIVFLFIGILIAFITHKIPTRWYRLLVILLPVSWALLGYVQVAGVTENGGARWISIGGISFQPSEIAKLATIAMTAFILSRNQNEDKAANPRAFRKILWVTGFSCFCIFFDNLSTAVLLAISVFFMLIIGRISWKQISKLVLAGVIAGVMGFIVLKFTPDNVLSEIPVIKRGVTWKHRLEHFDERGTYVSPQEYDIANNAQRGHANIAIATSGIFGRGPGNSVQRDFLSQAYSDFIFAIIIEELGLLPAAIIAFLYIWLLMRIAKIARQCDNYYLNFLIMGIGFIITTQAIFNMLVAVDIMPITGQPLPLISKGGSSTMINCVYFGLILGVSRKVEMEKLKRQQEEAEKQRQIQEAAETLLINTAQNIVNNNAANAESEQSPENDLDALVERAQTSDTETEEES